MSDKNWWVEVETDYTNVESELETVATDVSNDSAYLIAAAPEMYEALQFAVACNVGGGNKPMWLYEARAALAKARKQEGGVYYD